MKGQRNLFVASEGIPFLCATGALIGVILKFHGMLYAVLPVALFVYLYLIFRDPRRQVPAVPLGVICPVDGIVVDVVLTNKGVLDGEAQKIVIRVNSLGTYTARCPIEGKIMDLYGESLEQTVTNNTHGLWVRSDENDDIILQFYGNRFGLVPLAFLRYGERVGQGQRCAYLRLTRYAEVQLAVTSRVLVKVGQRVKAGADVLAKLAHP